MKYIIVLALALITSATHAALVSPQRLLLENSIYDLNPAALKKHLEGAHITAEEKAHLISFAGHIKTLHLPINKFYQSGPDILRIAVGLLTAYLGIGIVMHEEKFAENATEDTFLRMFCNTCGIAMGAHGIRNIHRGVNAYSAKENARKMLAILNVLENIKAQA